MQKTLLILSLSAATFSCLHADEHGELIFSDDFDRNESQETKDEPGNGWGTNSKSRAKGNKQVDLKDGAMWVYIHPEADHAVSVTHPAEFTDGAVAMKFMLEDPKDNLGLDFADAEEKSVHAGHLFVVRLKSDNVQIQDMKNGNMKNEIREARLNKTLTKEQSAQVAKLTKNFPAEIETGKWHDLLVQVAGDTITVTVDGKEAGEFSSDGFAHPTKRMLRLSVPRNAVVDDVRIWRKK
ncbi:MAG: hypothetical protein KDN19_17460 [Verrucomicrobiae bacterium]|nr:hypothetical protein [Verrucomicrobiae bacterium]